MIDSEPLRQGLVSRPIDIRMPLDNIHFWPTVDVRDIDSRWLETERLSSIPL